MEQKHHNSITYQAFRKGVIEELGYKIDELSNEQKDAIIKDLEENWWFCGGKDTAHGSHEHYSEDDRGEAGSVSDEILKRWEALWKHYFPHRSMPDDTEQCVCKQGGLRYNCFITNGDKVLVIGRICLIQFLPGQKGKLNRKRCERCMDVHSNRKDNFCKACRVLNKKDMEKREQQERYRQRVEMDRKQIELAIRQMEKERQEEERRAKHCACGGWKQPAYPVCWNCRQKQISEMSEIDKKKFFCECGKSKKAQFAHCFTCNASKKSSITV